MKEVSSLLYENISSIGGKLKIVSADILPYVQKEWLQCMEQLETAEMYHRMLKGYFNFALAPEIKSLIIIALPSPPCYVEIDWKTGRIEADIPPVYVHRGRQLTWIKETVRNVFEPYQLKSWPLVLPKKMLAAMSGFGKYGRNNILYIEGLGSCHRLTVFGSDMECTDKPELATDLRMDRCGKCGVCIKRCPTGAIDRDRKIINADKCLAFFNELDGTIPKWLQEDWHNCLVGCNKCQEQCPENKGLWNRKKVGSFSYEEIQMIMSDTPFEALDTALQTKIKELDLDRYYSVLSRNLDLLFTAGKYPLL